MGDIVSISGVTTAGLNSTYYINDILTNNKFLIHTPSSIGTVILGATPTASISSVLRQISTGSVLLNTYVISTTTTSASLVTIDKLSEISKCIVIETVNGVDNPTDMQDIVLSESTTIKDRAIVTVNNLYQFGSTILTIKLYANPALEFWKYTTDTHALDSTISGGSWIADNFVGALGISPQDVIVDGDSFINENAGHAPEECVAGQVIDSLSINVYTKKEDSNAIVLTGTFPVTEKNVTITADLGIKDSAIGGIRVSFNGITFQRIPGNEAFSNDNQFFIEGSKITIPPQLSLGRVGYTIIMVGGEDVIDGNSVVTFAEEREALVFSTSSIDDIRMVYVLVDGVEISKTENINNYGYMLQPVSSSNNRAAVMVYNLPIGAHTVEAWFFTNPYSKFNRFNEQLEAVVVPTTEIILSNPPEKNGTPSSHSIVEVSYGSDTSERKRLSPPWVTYYEISNNNTSFIIDTKNNWDNNLYNLNTIKVYANGILLTSGFDYNINNTLGTINLTPGLLTNGDTIAIEILIDYDYIIFGSTLRLTTPVENCSVKITTFSNHDNLMMRTERFNPTSYNRYKLSKAPVSASYVWVSVNGLFLLPNYDFEILEDGITIQLSNEYPVEAFADIIISSIDAPLYGGQLLGYRMFKDMAGKVSYYRLAKAHTTVLSKELRFSDTEIYVEDSSKLLTPNPVQNRPGVVFLDSERIEFFNRNNNVLSQLRRTTMGTGPAFYAEAGTRVVDQSPMQKLPAIGLGWSDTKNIQNIIATTATTYTISTVSNTANSLQFDGIKLSMLTDAVHQVEVFYGGRQLRKSSLEVHDNSIAYDSASSMIINGVMTSTNIVLKPEFSITTATQELHLALSEEIVAGTRITITQTTGTIWQGNESLLTSNSSQATFLRECEAELPSVYYYGGDPTLLEDNNIPLTDDNEDPLEGY